MATQTRKLEIRVGIVAIVAIVALFGGILWGKRAGIGIDRQKVEVLFGNASGIAPSTPVNVYGVKKGAVQSVEATSDGALVTLMVDRDIDVHEDAHAVIRIMEITGGKKIELFPGSSTVAYSDQNTIPGVNEGDLGVIMATFNNLAQQVGPTLQRLDSVLIAAFNIVGNEEFQQDATAAVKSFAEVGSDLSSLLKDNRVKVERAITNLDGLLTEIRVFAGQNAPVLRDALRNGDTLLTETRVAVQDARSTLDKVDRMIEKLDGLASDIKEGEGTVSRLIYDKELADEITKTINAIRKTLRDFAEKGVNVNMEVGHQ